MMRPRPEPTEFQMSGGIIGIVIIGGAVVGVIYAILKSLGWL